MDISPRNASGSAWMHLNSAEVPERSSQAQRHASVSPTRNSFTDAVSGTIQLLRSRSATGRFAPPNDPNEDTIIENSGGGRSFAMIGSMSERLRSKLAIKQQKTNVLELKNDQTKQYRTLTLRELFQFIRDEIHETEQFTTLNGKAREEMEGVPKKGHKYSGGWLTQRDLRRLETAYAPQEEPVLIVRRHCILFSFDLLRGIILWDRIVVLVPDGADSVLLYLEQNLFEYETEEQMASADKILPKESAKRPAYGFLGGMLQVAKANTATNHGYEGERPTLGRLDTHTQKLIKEPSKVTFTDARPARAKSFSDLKSLMEARTDSPDSNLVEKGPFEIHALEAVLNTVVEMQSNEHDHLYTQVQRQLRILSSSANVSVDNQEALRILKNLVSAQEARVRRCKTVLEDMLEEDEDMALMNLTKLRRDPKLYSWPLSDDILSHHGEVELLLEAYLTDYNSVLNKLEVLGNQIHNSEESVLLRLDNVRNQFLLAGTIMALLSTWFTFGATIAGIFGQNLIDNLEDDPFYFNLITSLTAGVIVFAVSVGLWILMRMWRGKALF